MGLHTSSTLFINMQSVPTYRLDCFCLVNGLALSTRRHFLGCMLTYCHDNALPWQQQQQQHSNTAMVPGQLLPREMACCYQHQTITQSNAENMEQNLVRLKQFRYNVFLKKHSRLALDFVPYRRCSYNLTDGNAFTCKQHVTPCSSTRPQLALDLVIPGRV